MNYNTYTPKNRKWEWNASKGYASRNLNSPAKGARKASRKAARKAAQVAKNVTIKGTVTLESLGLSFEPTAVRRASIVG